MNFNRNYTIIGLLGIVVYTMFITQLNRLYIAGVSGIIAAYIYYTSTLLTPNYEGYRERWEIARKSPTGMNRLPLWMLIEKNRLQIEDINDRGLFGYIDPDDRKRHGVSIDKKGVIKSMWDPNVNKLGYSDWRRLEEERAYNRGELLNEERVRSWAEKHNYILVYKVKDKKGNTLLDNKNVGE